MSAKPDPYLDLKTAAALVSSEYFGTTKRALERWPLRGIMLHGRIHLRESVVRAYAQSLLDAAPATGAPQRIRKIAERETPSPI